MKKIFIIIAAAGILLTAGCATTPEDVEQPAAADKTAAAEKPEETGKTAVTETVFIPHVIRETDFFSDGYVESYKVYSLNEDASPAREDLFDSFDEIIESIVYDRISPTEVKRTLFNARGVPMSWKKIINMPDGRTGRVESYNAADVLQTVSEYKYDADGNKTEWIVTDGDGVTLSTTSYVYAGGLNTRIEIKDRAMQLQEYFELEYDGDMLIKNSHYDGKSGLKSAIEYEYTDNELTRANYLRANGSIERIVEYQNDDRGNPVKTEFFDGNGSLRDWTETEYEYTTEEVTVWK